MGADWWNVYCELCSWRKTKRPTRVEAVGLGNLHSAEKHPDEYRFRVQGVKTRRDDGDDPR
jgi:hypothetical protein